MDTTFDILQALGIGAAIGIRPFLPVLLVGLLATANAGIDFDRTDWAFLESPAFLAVMLVLLVLFDVLRRRAGEDRFEVAPGRYLTGVVAGVLGALLGAGSVADHGGPVIVGLVVGAIAAVGALFAITPLFSRVRKRLDAGAAALLPVYREFAALVSAGLSVLFPPLAILVVGALAWLGAGGRRREGEKYAGLRILR
jgi:hypothetical protein